MCVYAVKDFKSGGTRATNCVAEPQKPIFFESKIVFA